MSKWQGGPMIIYPCASASVSSGWCGWGRGAHSGCRCSCACPRGPPCAAAGPSGSGSALHTADRTPPCQSLENAQDTDSYFSSVHRQGLKWENWVTLTLCASSEGKASFKEQVPLPKLTPLKARRHFQLRVFICSILDHESHCFPQEFSTQCTARQSHNQWLLPGALDV